MEWHTFTQKAKVKLTCVCHLTVVEHYQVWEQQKSTNTTVWLRSVARPCIFIISVNELSGSLSTLLRQPAKLNQVVKQTSMCSMSISPASWFGVRTFFNRMFPPSAVNLLRTKKNSKKNGMNFTLKTVAHRSAPLFVFIAQSPHGLSVCASSWIRTWACWSKGQLCGSRCSDMLAVAGPLGC